MFRITGTEKGQRFHDGDTEPTALAESIQIGSNRAGPTGLHSGVAHGSCIHVHFTLLRYPSNMIHLETLSAFAILL
jgi:hypothetical protein